MRRYGSADWLLVVCLPAAFASACGDPELESELVTEGPPELVEVNVLSQAAALFITDPVGLQLGEAATFCREGDGYRVHTTYCPLDRDEGNAPIPGAREVEPILDVIPYGPSLGFAAQWHVRLIFDELLDPDVETLVPDGQATVGTLAETQPVVLTCGGTEIPYDGFYDPSGNHLSFPPGPALVIQPLEFVASGTDDCEVSIDPGAVVDKDGDEVPDDQLGPYGFGIASLAIYGSSPVDATEGVDPAGDDLGQIVQVQFNAPIDLASVTADRFTLEDEDGALVAATFGAYQPDPADPDSAREDIVALIIDAPLAPLTTYTVTISSGIEDSAGGPLVLADPEVFSFVTGEGDAP